jgi:hypothetical protein
MENRPIRSPHENANGSSARRRSNPATCNNQNSSTSSNPPPQPPPSSSGPPPPTSRPVRVNLLAPNGRGISEDERERRRSIVDPDLNFEKFLLKDQQDPSSLLASPPKTPALDKSKVRPPPLRPQHVYAPMPAMGALSFLGKKSGDMDETDFSRLMNGKQY